MLVKSGETWYNRHNEMLEVMPVSEKMNVRRVAELAKIALTAEEEVRLSGEMEEILDFARQLQQLDVEGVPQTQHILDIANVLREDDVQPSLAQDAVLSAAPAREDTFIAVPRTVE